MSTFAVEAKKIRIFPHDNADALECAQIDGYVAVVRKGQFEDGEMLLYIPEEALLPEKMLRELGHWNEESQKGTLSGPLGNRLRAIKLQGVLSQGLLYRHADADLKPGHDYAPELGIEKYEEPIPISLAGEVYHVDGLKSYTEIENIKRYPHVFQEGEEVVFSEKAHGTSHIAYFDGDKVHYSSKGFAKRQMALRPMENAKGEALNFYHRAGAGANLDRILPLISKSLGDVPVQLHGEAIACQDLLYGYKKGDAPYLAFDLRAAGRFIDHDVFINLMRIHEVPVAPILYQGEFSLRALKEHTEGKTVINGANHIREGIVVCPIKERDDRELGRVILKSINPAYLTRKGGREFN